MISDIVRISPASVNPEVKNYHWLDLVMGLYDAYDRGGESVLLVDGAGNVVEGPGFNVFTVSEGRLFTPGSGMLRGVTRATIIELAARRGLDVYEGPLSVDSVFGADEVFVTSTAGGVVAATRINGKIVKEGQPGQVTGMLRRDYWDAHDEASFKTQVVYGQL